MIPAFYNGFPLVYSDTGTYIDSGMSLYVPVDRPIFYGLFIEIFSLGVSLWWVVFFQCLMLTFVLNKLLDVFLSKGFSKRILFLVVLVLTAFTSVGWFSAQIMPDIFTPLMSLAILILLLDDNLSKLNKAILIFIVLISILTHYSNLIIVLAYALIMLILMAFRSFRERIDVKYFWQKSLAFLILIGFSFLITIFTNQAIDNKAQVSKGSHMFLMGRLLDSGALKMFLDENCAENQYILCDIRDSLPESSRVLHWGAESPIHLTGGWIGSESAYWDIIWDMLKQPRYVGYLFIESVKVTFIQLTQNEFGAPLVSDWYGHESSPPFQNIKKYFPHEHNAYLQARQNTNLWGQKLQFEFLNQLAFLFLLFSSIFMATIIVFKNMNEKWLNPSLKFAIFWLMSSIILNAFITANFSVVCDRLQARVVWILPLMAILILLSNNRIKKYLKLDSN
jgi:hypothetical protein